jgi:enamine deaminase RidA (YjgF/YER057c/UK114 family)
MIYLAGQVALDIDGNLVGRDDFEAQVRQAFANVAAALEAAGADFRHVIKLTYYCADSVDLEVQLPAVRTIRDRFVNTASPPASTFLVVRSLARRDFLVEVEAIAVV